MSKRTMTENSMKRYLLDLPYEIVFEIFRRLSKDKLIEISRLCSKLKDIAGDTRLWKNVIIKHQPIHGPVGFQIFSFEELYSEPWRVKAMDLSSTWINPPVSAETDQLVKVNILDLSMIRRANKVTKEAILDVELADYHDHVMGIAPGAFSKQTALEKLSLGSKYQYEMDSLNTDDLILPYFHKWLTQVLSNCKNLKGLDLRRISFANFDLLDFAKILPTSLETLLLLSSLPCPEKSFFALLADRCPHLREIELCPSSVKSQYLLKFQYLETVHVFQCECQGLDDLCMYLLKFPALRAINVFDSWMRIFSISFSEESVEMLRSMLEPRGVIVELNEPFEWLSLHDCGEIWDVSKPV